MNRIIFVSVEDAWIKRIGESMGASASANAVTLRMAFDSAWEGSSKTAYFTDALGETSVKVVLGLDKLVAGLENTYDVPVPGEAMAQPGQATLTVVGESQGRVITTQAAKFRVLDSSLPDHAENSQPVTPDEAAQLQAQIDALEEIFVTNRQQAQAAADGAEHAKNAVLDALNHLPAGAVVVIDDLTTGGKTAALSAEQGKKLEETKANRQLSNLDTPQFALANLGAGVRQNLLINPYFQNAVNQRGKASYQDVPAIDGWYLGMGTMQLQKQANSEVWKVTGLTNTDSSSGRNSCVQRLENPKSYLGKTLTYTILCDSKANGVWASAYMNAGGPNVNSVSNDNGLSTITFTVPEGLSPSEFRVHWLIFPSETILPIAAKLEEGEGQTLAYKDSNGNWQLLPQPESDYATQLQKCQRYQLMLSSSGVTRIAVGYCATSTQIVVPLPVPVSMRTTPAVTYSNLSDLTLYVNGTTTLIPTAVYVNHSNAATVDLVFTVSGATAGSAAILRILSGGWLLLDANL
jgi:hypothetical protein